MSHLAAWSIGLEFGVGLARTGNWDKGMAWERSVLRWCHAHLLPPWPDELMVLFPYLGTNVVLLPVVALAASWLRYDRRVRGR